MEQYIKPQDINLPEYEGFLQDEMPMEKE